MGFSRQEYWSGLPFPTPRDLPYPGIEPESLMSPARDLGSRVQSQGWEDPLEKEMAIHSSVLAWGIPWTEDPGRLQSMWSQESDMTEQLNHHDHHHDTRHTKLNTNSPPKEFIVQRKEV